MSSDKANYSDYAIHLARIVGGVRTHIDFADRMAQKLGDKQSSFWGIIFRALVDKIVLESSKLIDGRRESVNMFSLMKILCRLHPKHKMEIQTDRKELNSLKDSFTPKLYRDEMLGHFRLHGKLETLDIDFGQIVRLLAYSEKLLRKYNLWEKGDRYSVDYTSMFAGGHESILADVDRLVVP